MRLKYLALASIALPAVPTVAQDAPVIVVTGRGLETTPATPAYDVIELEREQIVSGASGRIGLRNNGSTGACGRPSGISTTGGVTRSFAGGGTTRTG